MLLAVVAALVLPPPVRAGGTDDRSLRVGGLMPGYTRGSLTNSWTALQATLTNIGATSRQGRIVVFYAERPDVQYGRDVWLPANSVLTTWLPFGPAPPGADRARELQYLFFDRTVGENMLQMPNQPERIRSQLISYHRLEPSTTVLLDPPPEGDLEAPPDPASEEALDLVRVFRESAALSERMGLLTGQPLPAIPEALESIRHVVVATRTLGLDPPGQRTLRRWLQQGGKLWIMLDRTNSASVAPLLGESASPQLVDTASLTTVILRDRAGRLIDSHSFERPVDFVRVVPGPGDTVLQTIDGWPALFTRRVGRGEVIFTTLAARGWSWPRAENGPDSAFKDFPRLPVALPGFAAVARELQPTAQAQVFDVHALSPLVGDDIGYSIVRTSTAALVLAAFLAAVLVLGVALRRSRRPELVGWLGPCAAVVAAGIFVVLGEVSRRRVPSTVASVAVIDASSGSRAQAVNGLIAVYRPDAGPAQVATQHGGILELDMSGIQGQNRQHIASDTDHWHWENLNLPAGLRLGPFQATLDSAAPMDAVAKFTAQGVEGWVRAGPFHELSDAIIATPEGQPLAVRFTASGQFTVSDAELLPGQYLTDAVLTDRQQRRQAVYRTMFGKQIPEYLVNRSVLLAWSGQMNIPFELGDPDKTTGSTLLTIPLQFERPPVGETVTVPAAFIPCRRVIDGKAASRALTQSENKTDQQLRFQLPAALLPFNVTSARLSARLHAPARSVQIRGYKGTQRVDLWSQDSPDQVMDLTINRPELLQLDGEGGLYVNIAVSDLLRPIARGSSGQEAVWTLEGLRMHVTGQTITEP